MTDVWQELGSRLKLFEAFLRERFDRLTVDSPAELRDAMAYSLFAGGKRLRPMLCGLACEVGGGKFEQALPASAAVEMIHTYSLIHDDLPAMDDDDLRRGRPTCHKVFGDALAILAGDALQALAFQQLIECCEPTKIAVMVTELSRGSGAFGMVGGQVLDLIEDGRIKGSEQQISPEQRLENIHHRKTGALFRSSLVLGFLSAKTDSNSTGTKPTREKIEGYAEAFGLLFQVTDDLLDATCSTEQTGKKTGKDVERGKLTYPGLIGIDASREKASQLAEKCTTLMDGTNDGGKLLGLLAQSMVLRSK